VTTVRRASTDALVPPDEIVARLRAAGHSVGRTRAAVVAGVRSMGSAFTADELAAAVPDVHVSTVYRTLALLEEVGAVRHVHLSHGPALYEHGDSADVRHLVCEVCGRHVAVPSDVFGAARRRIERDFDFLLDGSHFAIVGRCREHAGVDTDDGVRDAHADHHDHAH
jgi:Fur family transcriptional regulator, ferric uptake regulator